MLEGFCLAAFWFSLSFTTCFGLNGHLQVCRILHIFIFICLKESASLLFGFHCLSLHVSTYMAIFKCVVYFIFICLMILLREQTNAYERNRQETRRKTAQEQNKWETCRVWPRIKRQRSRILKYIKINIWRILHTSRWPCRPKHVVKDSGDQNTINLHADGNITCKAQWTIQCSRMLKYSIMKILMTGDDTFSYWLIALRIPVTWVIVKL
jgi:hypothetical protein